MTLEISLGASPDATSEALARLHADAFEHPEDRWSADAFARTAAAPGGLWSVARGACGSPPLGVAVARVALDAADLLTICVAAAARRRGVGAALLARIERAAASSGATDLTLEAAADNSTALSFYMARGFAVVGRRPRYYRRADGDRVDALTLQKTIANVE